MNDLDIRLGVDICCQKITVWIIKGGKLVQDVQGTIILNEGIYHKPSLYLDYETAQKLMDQLWDCGLRPVEGAGSAGALSAVQSHLNDMRALVEKQYEVILSRDNGR